MANERPKKRLIKFNLGGVVIPLTRQGPAHLERYHGQRGPVSVYMYTGPNSGGCFETTVYYHGEHESFRCRTVATTEQQVTKWLTAEMTRLATILGYDVTD